MSISHTITRSITLPGGLSYTGSLAKSADQEVSIITNVAQNTTDALYALTLDVSQIQSLFILCDQDILLETDATNASGGNSLSIKANQAQTWQVNDLAVCPLTTDVTKVYITTGAVGASGANLVFIALVDPTV